ncbi:DEAD/DEAH box helicase family protein [Flavobacterium terrigena]|nr:DEAD/DEAH box helicase family protein [Flavobacterium terrigena]
MALPNSHFQDFPIEFKEINPEDFPFFQVDEKTIIEPDNRGYIDKQLQSNIKLGDKNTVVINAAVGQGKTYSIIEIAKRYYLDRSQEYLVFIASPFVSLVEQYCNDIVCEQIPKEKIYRYESIGQESISYIDKKIHIITVNGLLGNPGEDAFINSQAKRKYLNDLAKHCNDKNKKVVFIYDEIHDAIHNFKEEFIFNLWKWKSVIHKNFIISATFNEASKIVIEYLAELTDKKIQIIESKRNRIPKNQSALYLHYNPAKYFRHDNEQIRAVVEDVLERGKQVDILSYSKNLADDIVNPKNDGIGRELYKYYTKIQNCTSDLNSNQRIGKLDVANRFSKTDCNVGTNFKTGVSITKSNHAFIIIMPQRGEGMPFKNLNGIFSNGIISVIQALARQRKKGGEIHIILPPPESFDYLTLPFNDELKLEFAKFYEIIKDHSVTKELVKYIPLNNQNEILKEFYEEEYKGNLLNEIEEVENSERNNLVRLIFPEFKLFQLDYGEDYLANNFKFFGKDLSAYITYCAITNQFINCNLKGVTYKPIIVFKENKIQKRLQHFYKMYMDADTYQMLYRNNSDLGFYFEFRNNLFKNYRLKLNVNDDKYDTIKEYKNRNFEVQLIGFIQRILYPNYSFSASSRGFRDYEFSRKDYFLFSIAHAERLDLDEFTSDEYTSKRINAFRTLNYFRNKMIQGIQTSSSLTRGDYRYVFATPPSGFVNEHEKIRFESMIDYFVTQDRLTKNNIFEFKQRFKPTHTFKQKVKSFYTKLIEDFFETENYKKSTPPRRVVKVINSIHELPNQEEVLDFVSPADILFSDEYLEYNSYEIVDGKLIHTPI